MTSYLRTHRSPINNSKFKQLYSFRKAQRFNQTPHSPCSKQFYNNPISAINKRSTSFGYGNKLTLQNKQKIPSPDTYNPENTKYIKKGYSFNQDKKNNFNILENIPGPGKYENTFNNDKFTKLAYSIRNKYQDPLNMHKNQVGYKYQSIPSITKQGDYFYSKYKNSGCCKIGISKRFSKIDYISPGPGNYMDNVKEGMNKTGNYFNSQLKSNKSHGFSTTPRLLSNQSYTPGPGTYSRFTQFGQKQ